MPRTTRRTRPYAARVPIEVRREQLLDAALTVIDRDGYDRISIDAIARQAGVTRPVVYGAYDDLGALLDALLDRQQARALAQLYAAVPLSAWRGSSRSLVERAGPALHAMLLADPVTWRVILQTPASMPDVVRSRISGDREGVRAVIEQGLAALVPAGSDTEVLSHGVVALLERFGQLVLAEPDRFPAERLVAALVAILTSAPLPT